MSLNDTDEEDDPPDLCDSCGEPFEWTIYRDLCDTCQAENDAIIESDREAAIWYRRQ